MTTRYYPIQAHLTAVAAVWDMVKWLINDGHALTGPNWTVIETYAGSLAIPSDAHDLDTLPVGNRWRTGALSAGDWIILRSATGVAGTKMQVYIEYNSTTNMKLAMLPLDNWTTGGGGGSPPSAELNACKAIGGGGTFPGSLVDLIMFNAAANYTIVADEAMMAILCDDGTANCGWIYVGEVTPARLTGSPADNRPYVIIDSTIQVGIIAGGYWNRLSPIDDTTVLTTGYPAELYTATGYILNSGIDVNLLGLWLVLPVGVYIDNSGHQHFVGFLQNVASCNGDKGTSGTINSLAWMYRNDGGAAQHGVCFKWDGVTVV